MTVDLSAVDQHRICLKPSLRLVWTLPGQRPLAQVCLALALAYEGFNFLFYRGWLGSGFWLFLAALLGAGAGTILMAAAPLRPATVR